MSKQSTEISTAFVPGAHLDRLSVPRQDQMGAAYFNRYGTFYRISHCLTLAKA